MLSFQSSLSIPTIIPPVEQRAMTDLSRLLAASLNTLQREVAEPGSGPGPGQLAGRVRATLPGLAGDVRRWRRLEENTGEGV